MGLPVAKPARRPVAVAIPAGRRIVLTRKAKDYAMVVYQGDGKDARLFYPIDKGIPTMIVQWVKDFAPFLLKRLHGLRVENVSFSGDPQGGEWGFRFLPVITIQ